MMGSAQGTVGAEQEVTCAAAAATQPRCSAAAAGGN